MQGIFSIALQSVTGHAGYSQAVTVSVCFCAWQLVVAFAMDLNLHANKNSLRIFHV